jgi:hypothetical protein
MPEKISREVRNGKTVESKLDFATVVRLPNEGMNEEERRKQTWLTAQTGIPVVSWELTFPVQKQKLMTSARSLEANIVSRVQK